MTDAMRIQVVYAVGAEVDGRCRPCDGSGQQRLSEPQDEPPYYHHKYRVCHVCNGAGVSGYTYLCSEPVKVGDVVAVPVTRWSGGYPEELTASATVVSTTGGTWDGPVRSVKQIVERAEAKS